MGAQSLGGEDPLEEAWQPTPAFLPGESYVQRSLVGYSPQGHKESDTTEETARSQESRELQWLVLIRAERPVQAQLADLGKEGRVFQAERN